MSSTSVGRHGVIIAAVIFAATVVVFRGTLDNDFVRYDDQAFITENPGVLGGLSWHGIVTAFSRGTSANWVPLAFCSHMVDVELFGMDPTGHHATSLVLHALTAALLFLGWSRVRSTPEAAFVALAFALHPLRVESVAWAAERRDVLSGAFAAGAIALHLDTRARARRLGRISVVLLGACAMLSKPTAVTLPAVLLVLDVWPLARLRAWDLRTLAPLVVEKLPLALTAVIVSVITLGVQAPSAPQLANIAFRIAGVVVAFAHYLRDFVAPGKLAVLYPRPSAWPTDVVVTAALLCTVVLALALALRRRAPGVLVGVLWFAGVLVPMIGVVQVGEQAYADRYTYLAGIGLGIAAASLAQLVTERARALRIGAVVVAFGWLAWLSSKTVDQIHVWRDTTTLFQHAIDAGHDSALAEAALGNAAYAAGDLPAALPHLQAAARLSRTAHNLDRLARAQLRAGDAAAAKQGFLDALTAAPNVAEHHQGLASALLALGEAHAAVRELEIANELGGGGASLRLALGSALVASGERTRAVQELASVVDAPGATLPVVFGAAAVLADAGDDARALVVLEAAAARWPNSIDTWAAIALVHCASDELRDLEMARAAVNRLRAFSADAGRIQVLAACADGNAPEAAAGLRGEIFRPGLDVARD